MNKTCKQNFLTNAINKSFIIKLQKNLSNSLEKNLSTKVLNKSFEQKLRTKFVNMSCEQEFRTKVVNKSCK